MHTRISLAATCFFALAGLGIGSASQAQVLINQEKALSGASYGMWQDAPGFPVTIFGPGSYKLTSWQASEHVILDANPHATAKPRVPRAVLRHISEPAAQLLLLQKRDADIARNLNADELKGLIKNPDYRVENVDQLNSLYIGLNQALPQFQRPEVRQAFKWAIDYDAIADNLTPNVWNVWQTFLPRSSPGSTVSETSTTAGAAPP